MKTGIKILIGGGILAAGIAAFYFWKKKNATTGGGGTLSDMFGAGDPRVKGLSPQDKETYNSLPDDAAEADFLNTVQKAGGIKVMGTDGNGNPIVSASKEGTGSAEGSKITYISPRVSDGKVADSNMIEVRTSDALFSKGAMVQLNQPGYPNFKGTIVDTWDSGDGTGTVWLQTPYKDTGEKNSLGIPYDTRTGTIAVIGDVVAAPVSSGTTDTPSSFDGMPGDFDMEFSYAFGDEYHNAVGNVLANHKTSTKGKKWAGKHYIRLIPKSEAKQRIALKEKGKASGKKGMALKKYIMANVKKAPVRAQPKPLTTKK